MDPVRTFTRSALDAAREAWDAGDFPHEWRDVRHKAAMGGLIYPPSGTKYDSWDDDNPSQRAMLIRAIRETPALLERCLIGAPSWAVVIARLTRARDDWRADLASRTEEEAPTHREAVMALGDILRRIGDSV